MELLPNTIPSSHPIFKQLEDLASTSQLVIFSGLPGVGKSLYINEFQLIAKSMGREVDIIQWDVARKAFETPEILEHFPITDNTVHNGMKLIAGKWLMDTVDLWLDENLGSDRILLIEAPLVGHRFLELVTKSADEELEKILASDITKVIMPVPSVTVRQKIEEERARQVSEDAKVWSGAKPSVMLMLWKMTCGIANEFGQNIDLTGQPAYSPDVYKFVFSEILKHRHFVPLDIDTVFDVPEQDEQALHDSASIQADRDTANFYGEMIRASYTSEEIDSVVAKWYLT